MISVSVEGWFYELSLGLTSGDKAEIDSKWAKVNKIRFSLWFQLVYKADFISCHFN
jgi:hypothetical protein